MYNNIEIIDNVKHKNSGIKQIKNFSFAKKVISCPITIKEFYEACKTYPIVFTKDANKNWYASLMLGYKNNENVFVNDKGEWEKFSYVPAFVKRYPFVFVEHENKLILSVEKDYLIEKNKDKKLSLFNDKSEVSPILKNAIDFLNKFNEDSLITKSLVEELDNYNLLEEKTVSVETKNKEKFKINNIYIVNEEKLNGLTKKAKNEIFNKNLYPFITAHLISLTNLQKLGLR